jgi:mRNA interferase MazF
MVIIRGEIWWASMSEPKGSEPGFRRPVLVVQSDPFNKSAIRTVVVAALTSNVRLAEAPGNVRLTRRTSGLSRESVVNVSQLYTVDRDVLSERVGRVPAEALRKVEAGLRLVLGLG